MPKLNSTRQTVWASIMLQYFDLGYHDQYGERVSCDTWVKDQLSDRVAPPVVALEISLKPLKGGAEFHLRVEGSWCASGRPIIRWGYGGGNRVGCMLDGMEDILFPFFPRRIRDGVTLTVYAAVHPLTLQDWQNAGEGWEETRL